VVLGGAVGPAPPPPPLQAQFPGFDDPSARLQRRTTGPD
jgi:hypothetical protein